MKKIDLNYFPGWTRKVISFTIDDGNVPMDRKFLDIIKPYGIRGTFNLTSNFVTEHHGAEEIRDLYRGFEIANHVKYHPYAFESDAQPEIAEEPFPGKETADRETVYPVPEGIPGLYYRYCKENAAWQRAAISDAYLAFTDAGKAELEEIFGKGAVQGFAWPFCRQENAHIIETLKEQYAYLRTAGVRFGLEETTYDLPEDQTNWSVNARHSNLVIRGERFEKLPDTGRLKWLVFGVHSADFERDEAWGELEAFCKRFGNRQEEFWYASNLEIFRYQQALQAIEVTETAITNPGELTLYIKIDGQCIILLPESTLTI